MRDAIGRLLASPLLRQTLFMSAGRAAAQAAAFLAVILTARFFTPTQIGVVAFVTSIGQFVGSVASIRLESMALVARSERTRTVYLRMAYEATLIVTMISVLVVTLVIASGTADQQAGALPWIPLLILLTSVTSVIAPAQLTAEGRTGRVSTMILVGGAVSAALQIAVAFFAATITALLAARALGMVVSLLVGARSIAAVVVETFKASRSRFPLLKVARPEIGLGTLSQVLSILSFQLPTYVATAMGRPADAGAYWMAFNLLIVPYLIVAQSFRPVFLKYIRARPGLDAMRSMYLKSSLAACFAGLVAAGVISLAATLITPLLFGEHWASTSDYIVWIGVLLASLIAQTPLSAGSTAFGFQRLVLAQQAINIGLGALAYVVAQHLTGSPVTAFASYCVIRAISNFLFVAIGFRAIGVTSRKSS